MVNIEWLSLHRLLLVKGICLFDQIILNSADLGTVRGGVRANLKNLSLPQLLTLHVLILLLALLRLLDLAL